MQQKKDVILNGINEIMELFKKNGSITTTAKEFCKSKGISYEDTWRRQISRYLSNDEKTSVSAQKVIEKPQHSAKVLLFDIETAPILSYVWGAWKQNPGANLSMIENDWFIFTWAAKWLFDENVMTGKLTSQEAIQQNDSRIVKDLWQLLEEADVVIAHNGVKFDIKKVNTRFVLAGLTPPMHYQVIDTLLHARKTFSFTSNKLDYIAKSLGLEGKMQHEGFGLWDKCYRGDSDALDRMEAYNIQDIHVLEEVYLHLRPWIKPHPNIGLHVTDNAQCCASCGSDKLQWTGTYNTYANSYNAYRCGNCGSTGRSRTTSTSRKNTPQLTLSTPK